MLITEKDLKEIYVYLKKVLETRKLTKQEIYLWLMAKDALDNKKENQLC